jgi:hypothetical protein
MKELWTRLGLFLCLAGLSLAAVALTQAKKQKGLGEQIFERIGARANPSTEETAAVAQLFSTTLDARVAFLARALNNDAERLRSISGTKVAVFCLPLSPSVHKMLGELTTPFSTSA